MRVLDWF